MPNNIPASSYISVIDLTPEMNIRYISESSVDVVGYEPSELIGTPALSLVHPDELNPVGDLHYATVLNDKAASIVYMRHRHKDPEKGYVLVSICRTVAEDVVVGSVTLAVPGAGTMHAAASASEVNIITPEAMEFKYHRWGEANPLDDEPPSAPEPSQQATECPPLSARSTSNIHRLLNPTEEEPPAQKQVPRPPLSPVKPVPRAPLAPLSSRVALVLDRFSRALTITYMSNSRILPAVAQGKSFFDYVRARDERLVRSWLEAIKAWDAGAGGLGAGGGFGYGRFGLVTAGRNSRRKESGSRRRRDPDENLASDPNQGSARDGGRMRKTSTARATREGSTASVVGQRRPDPDPDVILVDGIFSAHSDGLLVVLRRNRQSS